MKPRKRTYKYAMAKLHTTGEVFPLPIIRMALPAIEPTIGCHAYFMWNFNTAVYGLITELLTEKKYKELMK